MKAYLEAKRLIFWRNVILVVVATLALFGLMAFAALMFFLGAA